MTDSLQASEDAAAAVAKTPNRVTLDSMKAKIASTEYIRPESAPELTIAILVTTSGFSLVGQSACADPANYNEELGQKFAFENALSKMWPLEGYLLREKLAE